MSNPIDEYEALLERIFSVYLDATEGFHSVARSARMAADPHKSMKRTQIIGAGAKRIYSLGSHKDGSYVELSARSHEKLIADNNDDGPNWDYMASMCVVTACQLWHEHYRKQVAKHLGQSEDRLKLPIFEDLRHFQNIIIHNNSKWSDELRKLDCFEWEEVPGASEEVHFPKRILTSIWWNMRLALRDLKLQHKTNHEKRQTRAITKRIATHTYGRASR